MILIESLLKFLLVFLLSFMFGIERQRSHKPIGFGTFIFVSIGSCSLAIVAISISPETPFPLLAATVTSIGFLGAGALIKTTDKIFGFTTAAGIWVFSIIGLLIGIGQYLLGLIVYISIWIVVFVDKILEDRGIGSYQKRVTLSLNHNIHSGKLAKIFGTNKYKIKSIDANVQNKIFTFCLLVEGPKSVVNSIPRRVYNMEGVLDFKFE